MQKVEWHHVNIERWRLWKTDDVMCKDVDGIDRASVLHFASHNTVISNNFVTINIWHFYAQ